MAAVGWGECDQGQQDAGHVEVQMPCGSPEGNCHCPPEQVIRDGRWTMSVQRRKGGKDGTKRTLKRCTKGNVLL